MCVIGSLHHLTPRCVRVVDVDFQWTVLRVMLVNISYRSTKNVYNNDGEHIMCLLLVVQRISMLPPEPLNGEPPNSQVLVVAAIF